MQEKLSIGKHDKDGTRSRMFRSFFCMAILALASISYGKGIQAIEVSFGYPWFRYTDLDNAVVLSGRLKPLTGVLITGVDIRVPLSQRVWLSPGLCVNTAVARNTHNSYFRYIDTSVDPFDTQYVKRTNEDKVNVNVISPGMAIGLDAVHMGKVCVSVIGGLITNVGVTNQRDTSFQAISPDYHICDTCTIEEQIGPFPPFQGSNESGGSTMFSLGAGFLGAIAANYPVSSALFLKLEFGYRYSFSTNMRGIFRVDSWYDGTMKNLNHNGPYLSLGLGYILRSARQGPAY